jgi:aminopeptidase YwaD
MEWISQLSFEPRPAGSLEDAKARKSIRALFERTGEFSVEEQSFGFQRYLPEKWGLAIDGERADCLPAVCSTRTPRSGLSGELCSSASRNVRGRIALVEASGTHESIAVETLGERGALAALVFQKRGPLLVGRVRYPLSSIPCLMISGQLGEKLSRTWSVRKHQVHVDLDARTARGRGRNVFAVPRNAEARALFVAHRDSRPFSPGAIDNASGTSLLAFLAARIAKPTFSLLSTDAEEYGVLGGRYFVSKHHDLDPRTNTVNLDSLGGGPLHLVKRTRGGHLSPSLNARISSVAEDMGLSLPRISTPRGSDCDVFLERGFRSSWLRSYPTPTATTIEDTMNHVRRSVIGQACLLLRGLVGHALNGA